MRTEKTELETYSFWHLDYGEVAYYDQPVFKRHEPIPPKSEGTTPSSPVGDAPQTAPKLTGCARPDRGRIDPIVSSTAPSPARTVRGDARM